MRTWSGIGIISTMRRTRLWECRWAVGWSRVRVSGSSNSASREWGCAGVRPDFTICYLSDSPGSTARLRRCFRYSSNHPPTRNYARMLLYALVEGQPGGGNSSTEKKLPPHRGVLPRRCQRYCLALAGLLVYRLGRDVGRLL